MEKRTFLKTGFLLTAAAASSSFWAACKGAAKGAAGVTAPLPPPKLRRTTPFALPPLPFEMAALEPNIDKMTMEIHHGKHHQAYVNNLNDAVKDTPYAEYELDDILYRITGTDADKKIRNNAGGHWNHTFFWQTLAPAGSGGAAPSGNLAASITTAFGSLDQLKEQFNNAAKGVFGSGWAWLCVGKDKSLFVSSTPNQDNPLMLQITPKTGTPILALDVWEHAYYLKYQNKRPDYVTAFWNVINWNTVTARYDKAMFG